METNSKTAPIVQEKDQNQVTLDLMRRMRLTGMANATRGEPIVHLCRGDDT